MPVCVYEGCFSGSKRKDKVRDPNIHLHKFPKDPEFRQIWIKQIHDAMQKNHIYKLHHTPQNVYKD
ncbi:Zinc finger, C2CH-type [Cinara cedri]|uniref:Zinc finger, C2CH-type n=1 Tax=Cinara cedri TaxID=506608 RepID=A0A5E4MEW0_9HEMI|nr:Zinc finger, C2CH-type [Cinara cedri]